MLLHSSNESKDLANVKAVYVHKVIEFQVLQTSIMFSGARYQEFLRNSSGLKMGTMPQCVGHSNHNRAEYRLDLGEFSS